jgi:hypothetical protein
MDENDVISNGAGRCKSFSYAHYSTQTHFFLGARIASVSGASVHLRSPSVAQPFAPINLVLPTSHLFDHMDHDEFFDLPFQGGG